MPKNIWLISDRPHIAGDNGEAIYQYLAKNKSKYNIRPYFVISKSSKDFKRLKKIGKVVPVSSRKHKFLALFAKCFVCSQTDYSLYTVFHHNYIKDIMLNKRHVFLQHGITKDDISNIYSKYYHNFDMVITAGYQEYESFIQNRNYGLSKESVQLTGFPRHDKLISDKKKIIIISPTWRKSLKFDKNDSSAIVKFKNSTYFKFYHDLLSNKILKANLLKYGYIIKFVPHDLMEDYISLFPTTKEIITVKQKEKVYSELFSEGALLLSDYSSNAFEFAYMRKPVIYCQFDRDEFFSSHTYKEGYFDYEINGFGPVTYSVDETVKEIIKFLKNDCKIEEKYLKNINSFFAFNDQLNCKRAVEKILKIRK